MLIGECVLIGSPDPALNDVKRGQELVGNAADIGDLVAGASDLTPHEFDGPATVLFGNQIPYGATRPVRRLLLHGNKVASRHDRKLTP